MKRTLLCPASMHTYSGYGFAFPVWNISTKMAICELIHYHVIPHSIVSNLGKYFMAKEVRQLAHDYEIH